MKNYLLLLLILGISCAYQGIDVSAWQGDINWSTVAQYKNFAIICAGYGIGNNDSYFETNYQNAKAAGVRVGAYWKSYAITIGDAQQEAYSAINALKGKQFEWPIYYNFEEQSILDTGNANANAKAFCEILEANRYYCGVYASASALSTYFDFDVKEQYTIWVSHWDVYQPTYYGDYGVWQYKDGTVPGISGQVNLDYGYIDFGPFMKSHSLNGY